MTPPLVITQRKWATVGVLQKEGKREGESERDAEMYTPFLQTSELSKYTLPPLNRNCDLERYFGQASRPADIHS